MCGHITRLVLVVFPAARAVSAASDEPHIGADGKPKLLVFGGKRKIRQNSRTGLPIRQHVMRRGDRGVANAGVKVGEFEGCFHSPRSFVELLDYETTATTSSGVGSSIR